MIKGFNLQINQTKYYIRCDWCVQATRNMEGNNYFTLNLVMLVKNLNTKKYLTGKEMKGTYLAEKISDYIQNTVNGQRRIYWDCNGVNEVSGVSDGVEHGE